MSDVVAIKVLLAHVEVSDKYGTSDPHIVGVFFDEESIDQAKKLFEETKAERRVAFEVKDCLPNKIYLTK